MKQQNFNLKNFRSKKWWLSELKQVRWTEILLLIALIMCYFQVQHVKEVSQDPCSFCIVNQYGGNKVTCKEYFTRIDLNQGGYNDIPFGNISFEKT